jgi:hypothetical protein
MNNLFALLAIYEKPRLSLADVEQSGGIFSGN